METWTHQTGFPLVTITKEGNEIIATQERFLLTATFNETLRQSPRNKFEYKWYIPLTFITDNDTDNVNTIWMNMTDIRFEVSPNLKWLKANVNQSGFYRIKYDKNLWLAIIETLRKNHLTFSAADRASLMDDAFTLCR